MSNSPTDLLAHRLPVKHMVETDSPSMPQVHPHLHDTEPGRPLIPNSSVDARRVSSKAGPSKPSRRRWPFQNGSSKDRQDSGVDADFEPTALPGHDTLVPQRIPYEVYAPKHYGLHNQGWTVLHFLKEHENPPRDLQGVTTGHPRPWPPAEPKAGTYDGHIWPSICQLRADAKTFFDTPEDYKRGYGKNNSEEGWTKISGEKEFITIRGMTSKYTPNEVRNAATAAWENVFKLLYEVLHDMEIALRLDAGALRRYCESSRKLGQEDCSSMIRIFRYENDEQYKILAEPHRDLGMLSLVVGDKPGLEVWNKARNAYIPIELDYEVGMCTLMAGRQIEHFSNSLYTAAPHRVVSYGPKQPAIGIMPAPHFAQRRVPLSDFVPPGVPPPFTLPPGIDSPRPAVAHTPSRMKRILTKFRSRDRSKATEQFNVPEQSIVPLKQPPAYRYSIVFVLRADSDVSLNYHLLSSPVTGDMKGIHAEGAPQTAGDLFDIIRKAHFNVNTHVDERLKQKQKLTEIPKNTEEQKNSRRRSEEAIAALDQPQGSSGKKSTKLTKGEDVDDFEPPPHPPPSFRPLPGSTHQAQSDPTT